MTKKELKFVMINLTDSKVGSGYRHFIVVSEGRKWVKLLYTPSMTVVKIPIAEYERFARVTPISQKVLKKQLLKARRYHKAYGMSYPKKIVKDMLDICSPPPTTKQDLLNL